MNLDLSVVNAPQRTALIQILPSLFMKARMLVFKLSYSF